MDTVGRLFNAYIGLITLGLVMFYLFSKPGETETIIGGAGEVGAGFIGSLQGR